MSTDQPPIQVGTFGGSFGIKGFLKVHTTGDALISTPMPISCEVKLNDGNTKSVKILEISSHGRSHIAKIEGYDSPESSSILRNGKIFLPKSQLPKLDPSEIYVIDLIGLNAVDRLAGRPLGYEIIEVIDNPAHPILRLRATDQTSQTKEVLVPFLNLYVGDWDKARREIEMRSWEFWFEI